MKIDFTLNARSTSVDVAPEMPLLWVLRDTLRLIATKFGCGTGACGACTVLMNGRAVRSCQTQAQSVRDRNIVTIEGLSSDGTHPVQRAWLEEDVPQCGYCQAGQMMAAVALLGQKPTPTDADVHAAMRGNLCRCGTYSSIVRAVHRAAHLKSEGAQQ
jgi:aerobic-type carbon monoxide dehydrogenase small subunit (CoxS/CutS family)